MKKSLEAATEIDKMLDTNDNIWKLATKKKRKEKRFQMIESNYHLLVVNLIRSDLLCVVYYVTALNKTG